MTLPPAPAPGRRSASAAQKPRLPWVDVAKGIAITLVVLHHAWQFLGATGWSVAWYDAVDVALTTLRMPLFFTVSGLLAASIVTMDFKTLFRKKLALLLYLYLLWSLVRTVIFSFVPWPLSDFDPLGNFFLALVWPSSGLWYLYALVLFTTIAWLTRRMPRWIVVGAATLLSVAFAATSLSTNLWTWDAMIVYLPFFLAGMSWRAAIIDFVAREKWWLPTVLIVAYLAIEAVVLLTGRGVGLSRIPVSALAVVAGLTLSAQIATTWAGRGLSTLGRQTLPIYVQHPIVIAIVVFVVPPILPGWVALFVVAAFAIAVSLLLHRLLNRFPGVYTLPTGRKRLATPPEQPLGPGAGERRRDQTRS
ncbi:Acyltransferase family protein [Rathayibacter oskolensis]|uniref:Acyltransferase family protein n=1 Tax=Rathayibacter oskolensis TaxID=1891671 RepID=A0A1X7NX08_9MICO|nr:acyltransferase family protein [Rathayibacter oskolensis]SMH42021.1 Acyltransferase family protein [Rathayibacter oskolensis]